MKQVFQYNRFPALLLFALALLSCKKEFLEINPKGVTIASKTSEYDALLYGLSDRASITPIMAMGDELAAVQPYFSTSALPMQRSFRWEDDLYDPEATAGREYSDQVTNLYMCNKVINEVMVSTGGTEQQKKALLAEARAFRAWSYFWLVNLYGKPYNPATAGTDPGVPIIIKADVTETNFTRASVKQVYDFIVADLTEALPDLPAQTTYRFRMSRHAAEGFLGKVYLFMGKYDEALAQLNASVAGMSSSSIPVGLYDYNETFAPSGIFMPVGVFGPAQPQAENDKESFMTRLANNELSSQIIINPQTVALLDSSDLRRNWYSPKPFSWSSVPDYLTKEMGLRRSGPTNAKIGVVVPDLYLLRAETKARLNDLAGAKQDVETLRKNRIKATDANGNPNPVIEVPSAIASDRKALVKFILDERIREFAAQGYRWLDMRRLSVDPEFSSTVGTTHRLYSASGAVQSTFTLKPERLVLRFPLIVIERTPGMENNP
jgi:starch-binding outer membrane protein, SusD/RagB family